MKLTLELELHDQPNPEHFQNFLGWASMLDRNAASGLKGPVPSGLPANGLPTDDPEAHTNSGQAQVQTTSGRGRGRGRGATAGEAAAALAAGQAEESQTGARQVSNGQDTSSHLPPGVVGAATQTPVQQPTQETSPLPPGVAAPTVQPQTPAMPHVSVAQAGDAVTIADVQASYADFAKRDAPKAFNWLKGEVWADGTPKDRWLNVNKIPPEQYERVLMELAAL